MENQEQVEPNFGQKIINLTKSLATWASAGCPIVDEKECSRRINICTLCDKCQLDEDKFPVKCKQCGCSLNFKVALATSKCPLNKW